ncbi:MAG: TIGR00730 family Rossman fold protein [Planctomycetia bacterium]|nr:TIGR00730 family Rossman fold protein [Planctomycetia bacterium]
MTDAPQRTSVCVFCGSSAGIDPVYVEAARLLGGQMAARRIQLVYGAGDVGLMGVVADAALAAGGQVIGYIPQSLVDREVAHEGLTELYVVETMHQRKAMMADRATAFLALPGGFGTADELFEILTWAQLGIHEKPIGLANINGFFDPLLSWLERATRDGFLRLKHRQLLLVDSDPIQLLDRVLNAPTVASSDKWVRPDQR